MIELCFLIFFYFDRIWSPNLAKPLQLHHKIEKNKTPIHQVEVRKEAFICLCKQKE
jgi:hypothetical protein